jgi:hypothetical protein
MAEVASGDVFGSKARRMDVVASAALLARPPGRKRGTLGFPPAVASEKSDVNFSSDGGLSFAQRVGNRLSLIPPL